MDQPDCGPIGLESSYCLKLVCWNINGVPGPALQDLGSLSTLHSYDVVCLQETMAWSLDDLSAFFPMHTAFLHQSPSHVRGTGVALLVHRKWARRCTRVHNPNPLMHLVAVKLQVPDVPHALTIASCYLPPVGSPQFHQTSMLDWYQHMSMFCAQSLAAQDAHLVAMGDFNAAISFGRGPDTRGTNESGRLLVGLASDNDMRFALQYTDTTPPSYYVHRDGKPVSSCPDHVLVSEGIAALTCAFVRRDVLGSDHRAIDVCIKWPSTPCLDQSIPLLPHFPVLRWKGITRTYAQELHRRITRGDMGAMHAALQHGALDAAMDSFEEVVIFSAIASGHTLHRPPNHPQLPQPVTSKPWFDSACTAARRHYFQLYRTLGQAHPDVMLAARSYHTMRRCKQRQWATAVVDDLIQQAVHQPKSFWRNFKSSKSSSPAASCASDVQGQALRPPLELF